jgi:hypothetical protein
VDPRGTGTLTHPRGALFDLADASGHEFPHLFRARGFTAARIAALSQQLAGTCPAGVSTVLFGSWGREELTELSDDDWAVMYREPIRRSDERVTAAVEAARLELGLEGHTPGTQQVFGGAFPTRRLAREIGLQGDGNRNFTRRILMLLECREVAGDELAPTRERLLSRYLNYAARPDRPPRFLLNDIVRYWRTIGVDFEGKHRDTRGNDPNWVLRNAKLRTARKMLFAGGIIPVLLCGLQQQEPMAAFLLRWFDAPAADRIAAAFLAYGAVAEGTRALAAYDRWIAIQSDRERRDELASLTYDTRDQSPVFDDVRKIGQQFERGLLALLFETELQSLARRYLVF